MILCYRGLRFGENAGDQRLISRQCFMGMRVKPKTTDMLVMGVDG